MTGVLISIAVSPHRSAHASYCSLTEWGLCVATWSVMRPAS
jgi:hypothetical protein